MCKTFKVSAKWSFPPIFFFFYLRSKTVAYVTARVWRQNHNSWANQWEEAAAETQSAHHYSAFITKRLHRPEGGCDAGWDAQWMSDSGNKETEILFSFF